MILRKSPEVIPTEEMLFNPFRQFEKARVGTGMHQIYASGPEGRLHTAIAGSDVRCTENVNGRKRRDIGLPDTGIR